MPGHRAERRDDRGGGGPGAGAGAGAGAAQAARDGEHRAEQEAGGRSAARALFSFGDQRNRALAVTGVSPRCPRSSSTPGNAVSVPGCPEVHAHDRPRSRCRQSPADRYRTGVGEVAGVHVVGQHGRVPGRAREAQHLGRGVLGGRRPEEGAGPAGEGGDPVAAALDLRAHRGRGHARERRVAPGVVAQLVAVVGHELGHVRVLRQPRADGQHRDGGAPVGQRREDAPGQARVARAVEGQRDLGRGPDVACTSSRAGPSGARDGAAARRGGLRHLRGHGPRGARHRRHPAGRDRRHRQRCEESAARHRHGDGPYTRL
jgi:hypothetical protein